MNYSIAHRISNFLNNYQPFNYFSFDELLIIANSIEVLTFEKNKIIYSTNDQLHDYFYIVNSGSIQLYVFIDAEESLINKCSVGDIFGLRPFFAKNNYQVTAKSREDSILYAIPIDIFRPFIGKNPDILNYLLESFAITGKLNSDQKSTGNSISEVAKYTENVSDLQLFQSLNYNKSPLLIPSQTSILQTAQLLTEKNLDNAIIIQNNFPIGIVTDKDFRSNVATGKIAATNSIDSIMASPVITTIEGISVAEAQLVLLKHDISHLCVTEDGTDKAIVKGVISEHDLIVAQANNPGILIKEIKIAQNAKELKIIREKLSNIIHTSITKNIPLPHIFSIAGEITLSIIKRSIDLAILDLGSPPVKFAWLCMGSQGRKEQLLLTDQDSILIFEDVAENKYRDTKDYFLKLAKKATSTLEKVGYSHCENGNSASNILWCKSLTDWNKQYSNWINSPGEFANEISSVFFDYEIAFGEQKIEDAITETICNNIKNNTLFFDFLGNDTIKKPSPLNFFNKFNLEEDGENKGKFDIKTKALLPLIDAARLMTLSLQIKGINNTYLRYKQLAISDFKHSEIYLACADAFLMISKFRTEQGLNDDSNGQFIAVDELSKIDRDKLKTYLAPIKELEDLIKDRFQLTQFS